MQETQAVLRDYILGPAHVGFVVEDMAQALSSAASLYGLAAEDIRHQPAVGEYAPTRFAFFTVGGLEFEFIEPISEEFRSMLLATPSGGAGINHVAWRVRDIDAAVAMLARRGVLPGHVTPEGVISIGDRKMVYLDPSTTGGQLVELIEYPSGA